jgi:hypothetical protein
MALGVTAHIGAIEKLVHAATIEPPITGGPRYGHLRVIDGGCASATLTQVSTPFTKSLILLQFSHGSDVQPKWWLQADDEAVC